MVLIATISILPFILMFVMSTQDNQMIFSGITFRIGTALKDNFRTILEADYFRSVINSLIVAVSSTVLTVIFSAMAGFAFAKYEFRNKKNIISGCSHDHDGSNGSRAGCLCVGNAHSSSVENLSPAHSSQHS